MDSPWVAVRDALKECARTPMWARSPQDLIDGLDNAQTLTSQLTALTLELLREIDGRGIPKAQGAANTTAWLRDRHRISSGTAHHHVKLATALDNQLPETAAALTDGTINLEQAQLIAKTIPDLPAEYRTDAEKLLLEDCATLDPRQLGIAADVLLDRIAPDAAERRAADALERGEQRAHTDRCLHLTNIHGDAPRGDEP